MSSTLSVKVQLDNVEQASSGLAKLGKSAQTTGQQLVQAGQQGSKFGQEITSGLGPGEGALSGTQTSMKKFSQETLQTQQSTFRLTGSLDQMGQALPNVNSGLNESGTAMEGLVSNTSKFQEDMSSAASETSNFSGALGGIGDSMGQLAGDANELGTGLSSITADTSGIDQLSSSTNELSGTGAETFGGALTSMNTEVEGATGGLDSTNMLLGDFTTNSESASSGAKAFDRWL